MAYTLTINGEQREADVPEGTPLLWVLRDSLDLKGSKYGCGIGSCGACTVHVDGQAIRSCITPVESIKGAKVTTIEGLEASPVGKALQDAWLSVDVIQCGYCQAGQLMSAAALLSRNAAPSDQDIDVAMQGNLCRCATYPRIRAAIKQAAQDAGGSA